MKNKISISNIFKNYGTIISGIIIILIFSIMKPYAFATYGNFINITRQISLLVVISLGATLIMSVEEFDLSIGAIASLGGVLGAKAAVAGLPTLLCFLGPVLICLIIGFVNGWIVTKFKVLSFITTLAMSTVMAGFTFWFTGGATVFENIPKSFGFVGSKSFLTIPILSILMIALTIIFWFVMKNTAFGRKLYAIGGNEEAASVAGIKVKKYKNLAFAICAGMAGLSGILMASRLGSAHPNGGDGLFLQAYASVFLGRTVFRGGVPNIIGTFIGAVILGVLANGLTILQVPTFMQDILTGLIIIVAVVAQRLGSDNK